MKKSSDKSYFEKTWNQVIYGNYSEDGTLLGLVIQVGMGFFGIDLPADIRDISVDFVKWEWTAGHAVKTAVDIAGLIPIVGGIKYLDDAGTLIKHSDEVGDVIKAVDKSNPLENIKFTDKVKEQMKQGDYHSFPDSVDGFGSNGKVTQITGGDKLVRTKVEIPGSYKGKDGVFEYIIEPDGVTCNHRLFKPNK